MSEANGSPSQEHPSLEEPAPAVQSLKELIDRVTGRITGLLPPEDAGLAERLPYPFLAIVGQTEMKLALLLALINPNMGGVLLIGPRGTGKTTAVRSLSDLLPQSPRSLCYYGCMPEDIEEGGIDAVCPDCAKKYAHGEPLAVMDTVRLIELPLNARLEDVVGGIDERAAAHERLQLKRGILSLADRNLLYIDEVNLLSDEVVDAILDAAAQGSYTVRRGPVTASYRSRFVFIGSMNPEEGRLRPQIMDRFGLRVLVRGLFGPGAEQQRLEAYRRVQAYQASPRHMAAQYTADIALVREEIQAARDRLSQVIFSEDALHLGLELIRQMEIDSLRAEITLFEASRAYAAMDGRLEVKMCDIQAIAPMALRMRRSSFMKDFFKDQEVEEKELSDLLYDF